MRLGLGLGLGLVWWENNLATRSLRMGLPHLACHGELHAVRVGHFGMLCERDTCRVRVWGCCWRCVLPAQPAATRGPAPVPTATCPFSSSSSSPPCRCFSCACCFLHCAVSACSSFSFNSSCCCCSLHSARSFWSSSCAVSWNKLRRGGTRSTGSIGCGVSAQLTQLAM